MPKRRKEGNKFTTISISWNDKDLMRRFAQFKRDTKNGKLYETDAEVFAKILNDYISEHKPVSILGKPTYPTIRESNNT